MRNRQRCIPVSLLLLLFVAACATVGTQPSGSAAGDQNPITLEEIEQVGGGNAYDLVQVKRPAWLRTRGTQSFNEGARGVGGGSGSSAAVTSTPGQTPIVVYMGSARLGGVEALRLIDIRTIGAVEFLGRAAADYRFGPGHLHGAIILQARN
jgi:hypothetical protein